MSVIFGTCSMKTGQASTHQRHIVHAQRTLSWITSPTSALPWAGAAPPAHRSWPSDEGGPLLHEALLQVQDEHLRVQLLAAHVGRAAEVQRPHSVQL